jgi:plastocyanin
MRSRLAAAFALFAVCSCSGDKGSTAPSGGAAPVLATLGISAPRNTLAVGATMQLTSSPKDSSGLPYTVIVSWGSGSNFVATVTSAGLVTGVAGGQAYMYAHGGSIADSTLVTVVTGAYPSSAAVYMLPEAYSPIQTDVAQGAVVQFVFPSVAHNVFFNAPPAGAPADIPGEVSNQTVARTFGTKGSFVYDCTIHPGMTATIIVH